MKEIYVSVDVETDGPIPGPNSMLSLGAAAFDEEGTLLESWQRNLHPIIGALPDPDTMAWWAKNPEAYEMTQRGQLPAKDAMCEFAAWVDSLEGKPVFVAYPAGFDFTFVYWYLMRFVGRSPFSFSALDIKSYAMAKLGCGYRNATKRNMPKEWFSERKHTHVAIEDAIEQGELFFNIKRWQG
ncbi:3'-5' exoribonuclease domain-containing protein [Methyloceanibacter caenitepidi]|uniref:Glycerol-3-phosphate ABC transporter, permease protein UgpE n=1 Tax=Methyloceanibacter caenitepidi TaxID=1384459 RepID=A0A0A8JZR4_9HYPH|nr:3'-5' exoribonuclease [Methyloceanibacter caenitepidi]BAQ16060.1 glycerol-3-phosphate ABC transporter, permease protein UgpE [Methyloceanibacter caenitepidi]